MSPSRPKVGAPSPRAGQAGAPRAPLNSVSTRIVLCVFASTLLTALIVSWLSIGAIHGDVRDGLRRQAHHLLAHHGRSLASWHAAASARLATSSAIGTPWHDALLGLARASAGAEPGPAFEWSVDEGEPADQRPSPAGLPAPPPELRSDFDRLRFRPRNALERTPPLDCMSVSIDVVERSAAIVGRLEGCLASDVLAERLQASSPGLRGLRLLVTNRLGHVVAASGPRAVLRRGERLPAALVQSALGGDLVDYREGNGARLVGTSTAIGDSGWLLTAETEHAQAFAPAIAIRNQIFAVDVCIVLLFSVLAHRITQAIMKPIKALSDGARRISEGHMNHEIPAPANRDDELGLLTSTFNEMMDRLRSNQLEIEQDRIRLAEKNEELQHANEILSQLSITDGLTKLHNHRYFQDYLTREIKRVSRTRDPLAMILLDIDDFKQLNDTYGHAAGDEVLTSLAAIMNDTARESDLIARYGGEEFVILMPNTDLAGAVHLAEKLRMSVESTRLIIGDGMKPIEITISLGVAVYAGDRRRFFAEADKALYQAKGAGKNCVIIAGAGAPEARPPS
ncbi:MAG: diguanylate cyclase [Myxococcota bacterium]